ncbi:hypothetical protein TRICI_000184 [Trichomonascus ciferrii]|uniref:Uncharacterized protein n=1 Tax=Trichomonascus ciferrii TaxID=44093 RepID=A0A642VE58_9ASCO|nr:hypothetical protein TRICI_000184 [Trichomonascus ciferrii]
MYSFRVHNESFDHVKKYKSKPGIASNANNSTVLDPFGYPLPVKVLNSGGVSVSDTLKSSVDTGEPGLPVKIGPNYWDLIIPFSHLNPLTP